MFFSSILLNGASNADQTLLISQLYLLLIEVAGCYEALFHTIPLTRHPLMMAITQNHVHIYTSNSFTEYKLYFNDQLYLHVNGIL